MQEFSARITRKHQAADPYFYVPFDVPEGVTRIDATLSYPKSEQCIIDLGVLDPRATDYPTDQGFRGWSGGARDRFFVATDDATPGYIHGEMPSGQWKVILGLYKIPEDGVEALVTVDYDSGPRAIAPQPERRFPVRKGAGWYRGDLHCHTFHSDAAGSPELLHAAARHAGLDFLAVADHNTITQRRYFHPHSSADLIFVRAMEVTTAVGHANVFGVDDWIDFRMTRPEHAHTLARLVHERGGLLSINHDKPTIPWDYDLPEIDCMEVWQSHWLAWNWVSLQRYQQRLASGLKISAIGGSDFHQPARLMPEGPLVLARPTTVVFLGELSEEAVLGAMKAGHGYVTEGPAGPHLELTANGRPMGSGVIGPVTAEALARGAKGDRLVWLDASGIIGEQTIETDDWTGRYAGSPDRFLRTEIVAVESRKAIVDAFRDALAGKNLPWELSEDDLASRVIRRAISNPIYCRSA
ncbi:MULTISPECIES: CehA/McbA family metallohydrolase [Ensifer]|uniref:CehA/McbA family metallohydrolase n=1 Tax=Ensifer TaxID=106591 RepID=UPI00080749E5|nr:CehA/McbA family metallohydrolase [Ensifer adhaerens]